MTFKEALRDKGVWIRVGIILGLMAAASILLSRVAVFVHEHAPEVGEVSGE